MSVVLQIQCYRKYQFNIKSVLINDRFIEIKPKSDEGILNEVFMCVYFIFFSMHVGAMLYNLYIDFIIYNYHVIGEC